MSELLRNIDARTRLAGTNKLEILLFTLGTDPRTGRRETFGINVFKVREVMRTPPITAAPEMPSSVEGMVSLRGVLVPVVDLAKYAGMGIDTPRDIMIVTEYNGHTHLRPVEAQDGVHRLDQKPLSVAVVLGHDHDVGFSFGDDPGVLGQVNHRHQLAAQADHALHRRGHFWRGGDFRGTHDFAHLEDIDAKRLAATSALVRSQREQQDLKLVGAGELGSRIDFFQKFRHSLLRKTLFCVTVSDMP